MKIFNFLLQRDILILLKRIIIINTVFICVILIFNVFIDFEELHKKLSFSNIVEYQTAVILVIFISEVLIFTFVILNWFYSKRIDINSLNKLIEKGEDESTEFKSSLRWDYKENKVNKELEFVVARTIAGFMNTKGGTLLIGINDEKTFTGLDKDYNTLKKKNSDGFLIHLTNILNNYLGKEFSAFWSASIIRNKGIDACKIDILPADKPVYTKYNNQEEFFVRTSATTQPMQIKEAHEYIKMHWKT